MTIGKGIKGFHLVRYGTAADQKYLLSPFLKTYDQLVINANMVAHMPGALAAFLMQRAKSKPYFIDPQTHAFQQDIGNLESTAAKSTGQIKKSVQALLKAYGEPVKTIIGDDHRSILPSDFKDNSVRRGFCRRVIRFQIDRISHEAMESDCAKYYEYLQQKKSLPVAEYKPTLVVAPYFYMTLNTFDDWIKLNVEFADYSKKKYASIIPVATQVVISKDLLVDRERCKKLIEHYARVKPSVFLIWIDNFSEQRANSHELSVFINLLKGFGNIAPVVNLYGGFFSVALKCSKAVEALVGVCHGLEYAEARSVVPVGGGIPVANFYHPVMHTRLAFREAVRAIQREGGMRSLDKFYRSVCDCDECKRVIRDDPVTDFAEYGRTRPISFMRKSQPMAREYPLPATKDHCVRHYMWCKEREYASSVSLRSVMRDLVRVERLEGTLGLGAVAYASVWKRILAKLTHKSER